MSGGRSGSLARGLAGARSDDMPGRDGSELARMPASALSGILVPPGMVPFALEPPRPRVACRPEFDDELRLQYMLRKRSVRCMQELTVRQAGELLTGWAAERRAVAGRRDDVVRVAVGAGLTKAEVHRLTGIARTTIDRIVGAAPAAAGGSR